MDIEQFPLCLELLSNSGSTLNHEKYNLLMNSLVILQNENHFKKVFFWGQIYGVQEDYYISFGYNTDAIRGRVFYYSRNGVTWVMLPVLRPKDRIHYLAYISTNRFYGNPALKIDVLDDQPTEVKSPDGENKIEEESKSDKLSRDIVTASDAIKDTTKRLSVEVHRHLGHSRHQSVSLPLRLYMRSIRNGRTSTLHMFLIIKEISNDYRLKEEDRLAAVVKFINQEAAIVPRGSLFKQTNGHVVDNPAFTGLQCDEATILSNYMHYRVPRERWEINVGRRPDYNYATDFLDTIAEDIPKNSKIQLFNAQLTTNIKCFIVLY